MCNTKKTKTKKSGKQVKKHQYENKLGKHPFFWFCRELILIAFPDCWGGGERKTERNTF